MDSIEFHTTPGDKLLVLQTFVNDVRIQEQMYITLKLEDKLRFGYDILSLRASRITHALFTPTRNVKRCEGCQLFPVLQGIPP